MIEYMPLVVGDPCLVLGACVVGVVVVCDKRSRLVKQLVFAIYTEWGYIWP